MSVISGDWWGQWQFTEVGGIIYVQWIGDPGLQQVGSQVGFQYGGTQYYWDDVTNRWMYRENDRWKTATWVAWQTGPIVPMYPFGRVDNDPVKGKPLHVWDNIEAAGGSVPTSASITSHHLDCRRWLRVAAYLTSADGFMEIPLLDADDQPWLSPERPWNVVCRWSDNSTADNVTTPGANNIRWSDSGVCVRPGANISAVVPTNFNHSVEWSLHPATVPVPHWKLRLGFTKNGSGVLTGNRTILADIVGTGYGLHASASREVAGGVGVHWKATLMWTQQGFRTTPSRAAFNERKLGVGVLHVANDPTGAAPGTLYLTTGVNEGLSTGAALFNDLPMCQVFGHAVLGTDVSNNASTNWRPQSWGMGISQSSSTPPGDPTRTRTYATAIEKDSVSGHYRVLVYNTGWNGSSQAPNAAFDRTYFVYALGKG